MNFSLFKYVPFFFLLLSLGCEKDFEEINRNPNQPDAVPENMLLTQIIFNTAEFNANRAYNQGNFITQHTAKQNFTDFDRYAWGPESGVWNNMYDRIRDINNMIELARENNSVNYEGIGYVWRAFCFASLTDVYGDIPFTEAILGRDEGVYSPAYDPQEVVYEGIMEDLKRANETLDPSGIPIEGDIFYGNDVMKWRKMANSLRLRYLMRISNVKDVSADMAEILTNPGDFPIFESLEDQAALTYLASAPNQWFTHTGRAGSFAERRMSATIQTRFENLNDPRVSAYFRPTEAYADGDTNVQYLGVPNGLGEAEALDWNGGSRFQSRLDQKYFEEPNSAEAIVMTYFELQFILAEAAERGLIGGSAQAYYEEGVRSALRYYDVEEADIDAYMAQTEVSLSNGEPMEKILLQKWIGNFMVGFEGWCDWRRTGLPDFEPAISDDNNNRVPVRFIYPQSEQSLNATNRAQAIARQGPDDINTRIWWMGN